ncbi:nuclease-related domain-containing protein [Microbacterium sp. 77mftsu3.1]|uniref:nuclease-related domain-containing protein n=1 Tax=Microbacterium sp. 77mftsu3.1 TaxID=1761802 RepID=UPI000364254E|nr:nuclease-related domain-containing protein [Microbacterium sp. 77mftsu3.1]SDH39884.1 Nuclease-related domain-containing protein [Microbacterium sp. 77mftsu3.1]
MTSIGRAGGSLENATFAPAATAKAGQVGEVRTAKALDELAVKRGFTVLHDLRIPGSKANIDHVVVAGSKVWVIDSKLWKPGFYFTLAGRTFRGLERIPHADKRGLPLGHNRLRQYLGNLATMQRPLMVIHPSRGSVSIWAFRPAGDPDAKPRAVHPAQLRFPAKAADPRIVTALARLAY